jgi:anti-sigma regulatory factor (Ser/Thr protein kinase)
LLVSSAFRTAFRLSEEAEAAMTPPQTSVERRSTPSGQRRAVLREALDLSVERRGLPADHEVPARLRRIIRASLTHWGQTDMIDTAALLLTELTTNALRHGEGAEIGVRILPQDGRLRIEVCDGSPARPVLRHASPDDECGRGLFLVEALAESWGTTPDGTSTWCTLRLTEGPE